MSLDEMLEGVGLELEGIRRRFLPRSLGQFKLTFIARVEGKPEADVLVTEDSEAGLRAAIDRSFARPEIREAPHA